MGRKGARASTPTTSDTGGKRSKKTTKKALQPKPKEQATAEATGLPRRLTLRVRAPVDYVLATHGFTRDDSDDAMLGVETLAMMMVETPVVVMTPVEALAMVETLTLAMLTVEALAMLTDIADARGAVGDAADADDAGDVVEGVPVASAAGNDNDNVLHYLRTPVMLMAGHTPDEVVAFFSSETPKVSSVAGS
ncbi:hypothetical protein PR002_g18434 [Phytophthora rubi]|uniref:Uncharacterized protein n=1 Tax=Phytophthora rubi TaxID=129364 RepID=A0A6A3K468_9STRA|nr:hypothetical protein PR002_g18434 [Phytophthora rubi]